MKIIESVRDAMQGVEQFIPTKQKIDFINLLLKVGFDVIDFSSFVSRKQIPQLADAAEVLAGLDTSGSSTKLLALVGSKKGAEIASRKEKVDFIAYPFSVSETFQKYNLNADFKKSFETVEFIQDLCLKTGKEIALYIAMAFGNPYGDIWNADLVFNWVEKFRKIDVKQITFSDPAAVAKAETITELFSRFSYEYSDTEVEFGIHIHSEPDKWYDKVHAAYQNGCRKFDAVINGFGGCPMSKKALVSNLKTEHLLQYLKKNAHDFPNLNRQAYQSALQKASEIFPAL